MERTFAALLLALSLVAGCGPSTRGLGPGGPGPGPSGGNCPAGCMSCDAKGNCIDCTPGKNACTGDVVVSCNDDGTLGATVKTCDAAHGEHCSGGGNCLSACDVAASSHSYMGCDYWPVTTLTSQLNPYFDFAVAVANPLGVGDVTQSAPATVTVTRKGKTVATKVVASGDVATITLPWVPELAQNPQPLSPGLPETPGLVAGGAYHLTSTLPVTVYQFSPLQFEKPETATCTDPIPNGKTCHSYSNDATILLPTAALKKDYLVFSRQTFAIDSGGFGLQPLPGFAAVIATEDKTSVTIQYTAYTETGGNVPGQKPGGMATYTLNKGDVLQVVSKRDTVPCAGNFMDADGTYCDMGPKYDLTGSHVTSDKPIEVIGGHTCSFVPYNKWACDHLETSLTPVDDWGQKVVVVQTEPQIAHEPNVWRVMSGSMGNMITFDPPKTHAPVMLDVGQYVEFIAEGGFMASGSGRTAVGQYMVGENYFGRMGVTVGDPSLGMGVNVEQFRNNYDFLTPSTYTKSYVNVVAPVMANLVLDQKTNIGMSDLTAIGASGYGYKRVSLIPGAHHITGDSKFGITVSGVASFTSYLYVGGQDLNDIPVQ